MEAALRGTLTVDVGGCVRMDSGDRAVTLVWPRGYGVRGDSESFEVLDGAGIVVARSGTVLTMGGGGADSFRDTWTEGDCASGGQLWMVGSIREG